MVGALMCVGLLPGTSLGQATPGLLLPVATAYDSAGNLFFADARRHQVFELTLAGIWSVVAGTGEQGFGGDGGAATSALLNGPRGIAVGADGTLYIADTGNQRVRAVAHGVISTLAGSGVRGFTGDGPALQAALRDPSALAVDTGGNLLVCDTGSQRVRRLIGGNLATFAGNGVQGFTGDGGPATAAELDTPLGIAASSDGRLLIADTHNNRVRQISSDGTIATIAGNGVRGFAGDRGQAQNAMLDQPAGVAFGPGGIVLIADLGNQRIRAVSLAGVIGTIAGTGAQGVSDDATAGTSAALNNPRSVSLQPQGPIVFSDSHNALVREVATDNALYTLALLAAPHSSAVTLSTGRSAIYGQAVASISVTGSAAAPQGTVRLLDSGMAVGSAQLSAGATAFNLGQLSSGNHTLTAAYAGDGLHGSSSSPAMPLTITPATALADASPVTSAYGASLPALTGTLSGVLPQDAGNVHASFSSTAGALSPPGTYPITATLLGAGSTNYALQMDPTSGALVISRAASATTLAPVAQTYSGFPLLLSATVAPATSGSPTGSVDFLDGSGTITSAILTNGVAAASVLSVSGGGHTYSARYNGDTNFLASNSATSSVTVAALPDFSLTFSSPAQTVQAGGVAVFPFSLSPQNGPFTGAVAFSVSGLPQGAVANFSPTSVIPGATTATASLSIQTAARSGSLRNTRQIQWLAGFGLLAMAWWLPLTSRWRRTPRLLAAILLAVVLAPLGCGTRSTGSQADPSQTVTLTVRGTGTNLAGATVSHSATVTLTVL